LNLFKKQRAGAEGISTLQRTTTPSTRRPSHPQTQTTTTSPDQAMRQIHAAADQAREEIAALVEAEHEAIGKEIASACEDAEERLRGATERRIDIEMKQQLEEAEKKLRRDIKRMVRVEVAKATKAPSTDPKSNGNDSVPIRARA